MKIGIGSDHRGYDLKNYLKEHTTIDGKTFDWIDYGAFTSDRSDYPLFAHSLVQALKRHEIEAGILICANGSGMAMAANRFKGIYAAVAWDPFVARTTREDDNMNVLVLPSDFVTQDQALDIIRAWLEANFKGGRYAQRLSMVDKFGH
jgi:ribose 5-phosphate isomerase B